MPSKRYKPQRRIKPKHSRTKKLLKNRFFWFGVAGLLVLVGAVYGLFFTPLLQIQHVEVQGAQKVPAEKLQELTRRHISKSFGFFQVNHLFLANANKVAAEIQQSFPEIERVIVDPTFPNKVQVRVTERGGVAVWCQQKTYTVEISEEQTTRTWRQCFALDGNGVIFEEIEPDRALVVETEQNNANAGDTVIEPHLLSILLAFRQEMDRSELFESIGLRISSAKVISEQRVNVRISEGWEMYLNPVEDMNWQTTKALLVLQEEIPAEKRSQLKYIDLRFGDQAYIKYR